MGNICRSPSAEGFFLHHVGKSPIAARLGADSAATHTYHLGYPPDERAIAEAARFGIDISGNVARRLGSGDFGAFDLILGMDERNLSSIERLRPAGARAEIGLMMDYAPESGLREVPDPYYGTQKDFAIMCDLLDLATRKLVARLEADLG
jgi:protein-tyrosine phosphatase